jgi:outer membrane immunogenic protein
MIAISSAVSLRRGFVHEKARICRLCSRIYARCNRFGHGRRLCRAAQPRAIAACDNRFGGAAIGGSLGYATVSARFTDRDGVHTNDEGGAGDVTYSRQGITVGGSASYNVQKCAAVFGIVGDISWVDGDSQRTYVLNQPGNAGPDIISHRLNWYGSLRTKMGLALDNLHLYTTGGIALSNGETNYSTRRTFNGGVINNASIGDDSRWGWVAGVGAEYALTRSISMTSEALYYDFGTRTGTATAVGGAPANLRYSFDDNFSMWVVRSGINIKLQREEVLVPIK